MSKKIGKRKRGEGPRMEGDVRLATVVTPKTIYKTKKDGSTVAEKVWVSLDTPTPKVTAVENLQQIPSSDEPVDMSSPPPETSRSYRVSIYQK